MSKIGPPEIRAKLYLAALCGLRFNIAMKSMYERLCLNGKDKMVAIGALMRKLIHWCFGVLKSRRKFDIDYVNLAKTQSSIGDNLSADPLVEAFYRGFLSLRGRVVSLVHELPLCAKSGSS